jgi:hypothetical protein
MRFSFKIVIFITVITAIIYHNRFKQVLNLNQTGGSRADIFNRFNYMPVRPFISSFVDPDPRSFFDPQRGRFSKKYNKRGRMKIIMGRPYRNHRMKDGNWGYPWHFPESSSVGCLQLASRRCKQPIDLTKDLIIPSKCIDSVYQQCREGGVGSLRIREAKVFV